MPVGRGDDNRNGDDDDDRRDDDADFEPFDGLAEANEAAHRRQVFESRVAAKFFFHRLAPFS